jgi:hypothetical protein
MAVLRAELREAKAAQLHAEEEAKRCFELAQVCTLSPVPTSSLFCPPSGVVSIICSTT